MPKSESIKVSFQPLLNPNFDFSTHLPKGPNAKKRELLFRNDHFDGFELHYTLDRSFGDLVFPTDPKRALSCAVMNGPDDECPTSGEWSEFTPTSVSPNHRTLTVIN